VKQYLGAAAFCLVTGVLGLWRGRNRNYGWIIALTVASLFFAVLGWSAESQEVVRHTIDMWIYVTLAVIVSVGAIADEVIRIHKSRLPNPLRTHPADAPWALPAQRRRPGGSIAIDAAPGLRLFTRRRARLLVMRVTGQRRNGVVD
jgi:hypothetical protein